jgi:hypothetical protein
MSIIPFLQTKAFDAEITTAMGTAFDKVCEKLGLNPTPGPFTESVAKVVIELAQTGERDPDRLYALAMEQFGKSK